MRSIILLPSYKPDEKLIRCLDSLTREGFEEFLIVDDGSGEEYNHLFEEACGKFKGCKVIKHAVNLGKGRALKTGFNYALNHYDGLTGVISCDSDGQHEASAVKAASEAMVAHPNDLILGTRKFFKGENVPFANLLGNTITRLVFKLLCGLSFGDTQCGLRAYPVSIMKKFLKVKGERFEYENLMLLELRKGKIDYIETPMKAIYIEENITSHFNKWKDSFWIYINLLQFAVFPIFAGIIAYIATMIFFATLPMCSLLKPALFYSAGLLIGWLVLIFFAPDEKNKWYTILYPLLHTFICGVLFYWLFNYQTIAFHGAYWICAILAVPSAYTIYLRMRYGRRPKRTKRDR